MATITDWNPGKVVDYSSLYPWLGTEIVWVIGGAFLLVFFCWILFSFDREDYDK